MYYPIENGTCIEIPDNAFGFIYKCWIPPIGFGQHSFTGEILPTDILCRSDIPEEQYWERPMLPADWNVRRRKEKEVQHIDKTYIDPYLEDIRVREWHRRMCGVWFWNYNPKLGKSELIYITGLHYLYITYWKFQGKWMDFRLPDRDLFYVVSYCMFDMFCLGLNEITKRKNGKTARVGCWLYERTSRMNNHHGGVQSKADSDAEEVLWKAIVQPWQKLPDFFRPVYDRMKGDAPKDELRFFATAKRGSRTEEEYDDTEEPLESFIDFKPSSEAAYDGPELHSYVSDETSKTKKPVSIKERQNVVRFCSEIDGLFKGKQWYTTTVEIEPGETETPEFQELTANSNPLERNENNRTGTGLYTYFLPAQKGLLFDMPYGHPKEAEALTYINNEIKGYENRGDTRGCSSFKRKNPRNFKEAFSTDGEYTLYNPELLNNQLDAISWTNKFTERGNLRWKDGHRVKLPAEKDGSTKSTPSEVEWEADPNGKFEKIVGWTPIDANNVYLHGLSFAPNNSSRYKIGCDPFRYDKTKDKRRSNCAAFVYQLPDNLHPDRFDDHFVLRYAYREESTRAANEDMLMMAWWCGAGVLFERNVNHWKDFFIDAECFKFLVWRAGEVEPGIITANGSVQDICNYTEAYINKHISKVYFKTLIRKDTGWLGFKVEDTEKFDEPMAAGLTLIEVNGHKQRQRPMQKELTDYFSFA